MPLIKLSFVLECLDSKTHHHLSVCYESVSTSHMCAATLPLTDVHTVSQGEQTWVWVLCEFLEGLLSDAG